MSIRRVPSRLPTGRCEGSFSFRSRAVEYRPAGRQRGAFTLIEMLAVVLIIAVLAAILMHLAGYASGRAERARAIADMQRIADALEEYRAHYGTYPIFDAPGNTPALSDEWVGALWRKPQMEGRRPFLKIPGMEGVSYEGFDQAAEWLAENIPSPPVDCPIIRDTFPPGAYPLYVFVIQTAIGSPPVVTRTRRANPPFFDPWFSGRMGADYGGEGEYQYRNPSRHNQPGSRFIYDLWSYGAGDPGDRYRVRFTDDAHWIANWKAD